MKVNVVSVSYSPDGSRIVSGSRDDTIRIWDSKSGECLLVLKGHEGDVSSVSYSPDGSRIVSGSHDDTIRIWDSKSGECLTALYSFSDGETAAIDKAGLLLASKDAWAWMGLKAHHPRTGMITRMPIEALYPFDENGYRRPGI